MRVYEAIVKGLESIGVEAAFGGAGENASGLMLALKHSKIRGVITKNEQAASFMACGQAMFSGRLGVCFATAGPGAFNLISGLAMAMTDSYPVLAITGYSSLLWEGFGGLNETSGRNRTPDSRAIFQATTKASFLLTDIDRTCDVLEEAINAAFEGRPGPVHIHVPENLTHRDQSVRNYQSPKVVIAPVTPSDERVEEVAQVLVRELRAGKNVLALIGFGAVLSRAGEELEKFLNWSQIPFVTTLDGKGILAEDHPLAAGVFCDAGHASAWKAFREADTVLCVGNSLNQHATFGFREDLFEGKKLIHINISGQEIDKAYKADHAIIGDARLTISALNSAMRRELEQQPKRQVEGHNFAEGIVHLLPHVHPGQLSQSLSRILPANAIVLADAGAHSCWLGYHLKLRPGQNFRKPGSYGPMAGHTNGALGVKLAHPDRPVIVGCGDGCYLMSGFEFMTAIEYNIPVVWIIFNDGEFKLIKIYQLSAYGESGLVEFKNPDYVAYAQACGGKGYRVENLDQFDRALKEALASNKPAIIDAAIFRQALPNYSPTPNGVLAGIVETVASRFGPKR